MEELPEQPHQKAPDLLITIRVSFETMLKRIEKRGRDYEQIKTDPSLVDYYHRLLKHYDTWMKEYNASPLLIIDGDKYDFVANMADRVTVLEQIEHKLVELGNLSHDHLLNLKTKHSELLA